MSIIKNFTPHPVTILDEENKIIRTIESSGLVRLKTSTVSAGNVDGIPISKTVFGDPEGLPDEFFWAMQTQNEQTGEIEEDIENPQYGKPTTYYIVSQLVKNALPHRADLLVPAEVQRDETGRVIGCRSLGS